MTALLAILSVLGRINSVALAVGRTLGYGALALMVIAILLQIFFRYALNNALPWPEEAARGLMIWMMALVAPSAYRHAGFVSIEMVPHMLPRRWRDELKGASGRIVADDPEATAPRLIDRGTATLANARQPSITARRGVLARP